MRATKFGNMLWMPGFGWEFNSGLYQMYVWSSTTSTSSRWTVINDFYSYFLLPMIIHWSLQGVRCWETATVLSTSFTFRKSGFFCMVLYREVKLQTFVMIKCKIICRNYRVHRNTETPEHIGNYRNTLFFSFYIIKDCFYNLIAVCLCVGCC